MRGSDEAGLSLPPTPINQILFVGCPGREHDPKEGAGSFQEKPIPGKGLRCWLTTLSAAGRIRHSGQKRNLGKFISGIPKQLWERK